MTPWTHDAELFALMREKLFPAVIGDILDTMGLLHQFLPAHIRPDRCNVVIGTINNGNEAILYVDPTHRDAWREPAFSDALGLFCSRGIPVYVSCNDQITRVF